MPLGPPDERELRWNQPPLQFSTRPGIGRWPRFCWWLSRKLRGHSVFGRQDLTGEEEQ